MRYKVGLTQKSKYSPKKRTGLRNYNYISGLNFTQNKPVYKSKSSVVKKKKPKGSFGYAVKKIIFIFSGFLFFVGLLAVIGVAIYLKNLEQSLPDPSKLVERDSQLSTQIYDRNGRLLYTFYGDQNREFVALTDLKDYTKWAVLAAEDIEFYQHKGLDIPGVARAGLQYFGIIPGSSGASTITQQLIRNTILLDIMGQEVYERSMIRKVKEMLLTMQIEQTLSKDEIMQLYMNEIFWGGVNYGIQSASKAYFGKDAKSLTLAESALIAGLIQSPSKYNPINGTNPELAKERQEYVLDQMLKHKELTGVTEEEIASAKLEEMVYKSANLDILAPHFVFYVKQQLENLFGPDRVIHGGLKVKTTLDYSVQKIALEEIKVGIAKYGVKYGVRNGAMVAINPKTGEIIAMVGSIDYNSKNKKIDGNVNVTIANRQMGSSVKPYTYLTAFHMGYGPWLEAPDISGMNFGNYKLVNWDKKYLGPMVARQSLIQSRNIPAVYVAQLVGVDNFIKTAETFGITTLTNRDRYGLSITLGAAEMKLLEHAGAYTVFANGGIKRDILSIIDVKDSSGNVLYTKPENKGERVWDEKEIYMLNWVLCDLGGFGDQPMNNYYKLNGVRKFCGKTGTTDGPKDLTSMMYTKSLVVGVWAGNNDNTETPGAWSTTVPLPIASSFMTRVAGKYKPETFIRPAGISATTVCYDTGESAGKDNPCKKTSSIYITGHAPKVDGRETVYICKDNQLLSSNEAFAREHNLGVNKYLIKKTLENDKQQSAYQKALLASKSASYLFVLPESGECKIPVIPGGAPTVEIYTPSAGETLYAGGTVDISAYANASTAVAKVEFMFDGTLVNSDTTSPYGYVYTIPGGTSAGTHSVTAIVYDTEGRTSSDIQSVTVSSTVFTVSINSPISGATISSLPYSFTATATATGLASATFYIAGPGYSKNIDDSNPNDGISISFNEAGAPNGAYTVIVKVRKGSQEVSSGIVSFSISR